MKLFKKEGLEFYIIVLLISVFLFDFITKVHVIYDLKGFIRYSAIPKLVIELLLVCFLLKNFFKAKVNIYYLILISVSVFFGTLFVEHDLDFDFIYRKGYTLNKYLFSFILASVILSINIENQKKTINTIEKTILIIGILNSIFIIIGLMTNTELFRSYPHSLRFGFNGFFVKTSETSYLYILLIISTYYYYKKTSKGSFLCLYFILISLLIGTKVIWFFLFFLVMIHFLLNSRRVVRIFFKIYFVLVSIIVIFKGELITNFIVNSFSFGPKLFKEHGLITVLTSKRDLLFISTYDYVIENWTIINYLLGGIDNKKYGVEFELIDIFAFFGIIGSVLFSILINRVYRFHLFDRLKLILFIYFFMVVFSAGNFFTSIICSSFAFIVFFKMNDYNEYKNYQTINKAG